MNGVDVGYGTMSSPWRPAMCRLPGVVDGHAVSGLAVRVLTFDEEQESTFVDAGRRPLSRACEHSYRCATTGTPAVREDAKWIVELTEGRRGCASRG